MSTHYIDPVDGSDGTGDDTNINTPRKTWPSTFTATDTYLGKGGTTANITAELVVDNDDVTIGTYPLDMSLGNHHLLADGVTGNAVVIINADRGTLEYLTIEPGTISGDKDGVNVSSTKSDAILRYLTIIGTVNDTTGSAIQYVGNAPFQIHNITVTGFSHGIAIAVGNTTNATATPVGHTYIRDCNIALTPHANREDVSAGVRFTGSTTWNHEIQLHDLDISGFHKDGISFVGAGECIAYNLTIHDNTETSIGSNGLKLGAVATDLGDHIIYNVHIYNINNSATTGHGISTRGGRRCVIYGFLIEDCTSSGVVQASSGSTDNEFYNGTIRRCARAMNNSEGTSTFKNIIADDNPIAIDYLAGTANYGNCCFNKGTIHASATSSGGNIHSDPLLNADGSVAANSPALGKGTKWWPISKVAAWPTSYGGEPIPTYGIDIGAVQSTTSLFHPVNL